MTARLLRSVALILLAAVAAAAQVRIEVPGASGRIHVNFSEPGDEGQAERLRELAARLKPVADQLHNFEDIEIVVVRSPRELEQRLGAEGALSGVSYVHGILFLSPMAWQVNPTDEALEQEMTVALVRNTVTRLAGGNRVPEWLESGLVSVLTRRPFAPASAEGIVRQAPLLLAQSESGDPAVGYWAVRYFVEARGGLGELRQTLRLLGQRPDSFVENLQLATGTPVGELERGWRAWLQRQVDEERRKREGGVREGPLIKKQ
ncbi:MAG: hypothetical protein ACRD4D_05485 [Candidatus Acidiferrales bacterium]